MGQIEVISICLLFTPHQHSSVDGHHEPHTPAAKSGSRQSLPRCRNSVTSTTDEQPHVGNYRLLKTIGKGNFAKVKLARHVLTGREVSAPAFPSAPSCPVVTHDLQCPLKRGNSTLCFCRSSGQSIRSFPYYHSNTKQVSHFWHLFG